MPIYEFECQKCEKVHEVMQKFSDPPMERCPDCGSPVQKLMSLSSFALKGEGWYTTDYKSKPSETKSESQSESKTESKSENKPENTKETKKTEKPSSTPKKSD